MDDLRLAARRYGWQHHDRPTVVCLPGLTRNAADFHQLALYLSKRNPDPFRVICFDYRGRGQSDHDPDWRNYNPMNTTLTRTQYLYITRWNTLLTLDTSRNVATWSNNRSTHTR